MSMSTRREFLHLTGAALSAAALPQAAAAQSWPTKPIRAMIPFSAGSTVDIVGRIVLEPLSAQLGQPIVSRTAAAPAARSDRLRSPSRSPTATPS
jgi:tripartite-type tricarboxylate transporter receptor subunit TctC